MPDTRPGSVFIDGVCGACRNFDKRKEVDWKAREAEFDKLLDSVRGKGRTYDVMVPVSGGKDSHRIVHEVLKRGIKPLLCTVTDSFTHTKAGTFNLRNLITWSGCNHWQYTISHDLFRRATRLAFEVTGEALKFVEYAIYTIPTKLAAELDIPLVIFGENSSFEYGSIAENSPNATGVVAATNQRMKGEIEFWEAGGVSYYEVMSLALPDGGLPNVIYLSYYFPWSSNENLAIARKYGFRSLVGEWNRRGTIEDFEQIDSQAYMVHLWLKYPKFGFQRVSDIASRRVREGFLTIEEAKKKIHEHDPQIDPIALQDFCDTLGYTVADFWRIVYTSNWCVYKEGLDG